MRCKVFEAGLDIEMPLRMLRARELPEPLRDGRVSRETVLRSVRRILMRTPPSSSPG